MWSSTIQLSQCDHALPGILTRMSTAMPSGSFAGSHGRAALVVKTTFSPTSSFTALVYLYGPHWCEPGRLCRSPIRTWRCPSPPTA